MEATLQSPFGQTVPEPGVVETFPDPAGTGKESYEVTISNVTDHGITFTVLLTRGGTTYHLLISDCRLTMESRSNFQIHLEISNCKQKMRLSSQLLDLFCSKEVLEKCWSGSTSHTKRFGSGHKLVYSPDTGWRTGTICIHGKTYRRPVEEHGDRKKASTSVRD